MAAKRNISTSFTISGEKEYRQSVAEMSASLKVLQSELKLVDSRYADNAESIEAVRAKQTALQQVFVAQNGVVASYAAGLANAKAQLDEFPSRLEALQRALTAARSELAALNATGESGSERYKQLVADVGEYEKAIRKYPASVAAAEKKIDDLTIKLNGAKTNANNFGVSIGENEKKLYQLNQLESAVLAIDYIGLPRYGEAREWIVGGVAPDWYDVSRWEYCGMLIEQMLDILLAYRKVCGMTVLGVF
jgi:chromosome segregation ATPase